MAKVISQRFLIGLLLLFPCRSVAARSADKLPAIVAHRGASIERPECTLAALRRAIELGADWVEIDVRTSRDGQLFLLHDRTST